MINNNTFVTVFVLAFAAFTFTRLAIAPVFVQDADAVRKKPKKNKHDFIINEPIIENIHHKDKHKNKQNHDFIIDAPVIK